MAELHGEVGGKEQFENLFKWAASGLSKSEIDAYNTVAKSGNLDAIKLAVRGMQAKFVAANGRDPQLAGGAQRQGGPQPFKSTAEVVAAMSDPRYKTDPAYNKAVTERLALSNIL